eukprot:TRINITY_DN7415_c0_g1_i1.p1 TRINITY_DN7415_c0_g1~~TRINITY_DN7415_c0_g1_i1.p1  ORF type:complete len:1494 (+),score=364.09 TRINITY_DN7415_c0_g1_i1:414-4484(+)
MFGVGILPNDTISSLLDLVDKFASEVNIPWVLLRFCQICGIVLPEVTINHLHSGSLTYLSKADITDFVHILKIPPIIDYYTSKYYIAKAKEHNYSKSSLSLLASAESRLENILNYPFPDIKLIYCQVMLWNSILDRNHVCDYDMVIRTLENSLQVHIKEYNLSSGELALDLYVDYLSARLSKVINKEMEDTALKSQPKVLDKPKIELQIKKFYEHLRKLDSSIALEFWDCISEAGKLFILGYVQVIDGYIESTLKHRSSFLQSLLDQEAMNFLSISIDPNLTELLFKKFITRSKNWDIENIHRDFVFSYLFPYDLLFGLCINTEGNKNEYCSLVNSSPLFTSLFYCNQSLYEKLKNLNVVDNKFTQFIQFIDPDKNTLLHLATKANKTDLIHLLVEEGLDVNLPNKDGETSLHNAVRKYNIPIISYLIEKKANLDAKTKEGFTPIHLAVNKEDVVMTLVKYGAMEKDTTYREIVTALYGKLHEWARAPVTNNEEEHCRRGINLVHSGYNAMQVDHNDNTPLHIACKMGNLPRVQIILKNFSNINFVNKKGHTPLSYAAKYKHVEICCYLLTFDASIAPLNPDQGKEIVRGMCNLFDKYNMKEPLILRALNSVHRNLLNALVEYNAPLYRFIEEKSCLFKILHQLKDLQIALLKGGDNLKENREKFRFLISLFGRMCDSYPTLVTDRHYLLKNRTLLHSALENYLPSLIPPLLKNEIPINIKDPLNGRSPFFIPYKYGYPKYYTQFWKYMNEKEYNLQDDFGNTPLHYSMSPPFRKFFSSYPNFQIQSKSIKNKKGETPLHVATRNAFLEGVELLVKDVDVTEMDNEGISPLNLSHRLLFVNEKGQDILSIHQHKIFESLVKNTKSIEKDTRQLLYNAAETGKLQVVKTLHKNNCSLNLKEPDGSTPLHVASKNNHLSIVEYLCDNGADIFAQDELGRSPFDVSTPWTFHMLESQYCKIKFSLKSDCIGDDSIPKNVLLDMAVSIGNLDLVKVLLKDKELLECTNLRGQTPLEVARISRQPKVYHFIKEETLIRKYPLHYEIINEETIKSKNLDQMEQCPILNYKNSLHLGSKLGKYNIVKNLIASKFDVNAVSEKTGRTALHYAVMYRRTKVVSLLLFSNADVEAQDQNGETPLHYAILQEDKEVVELLLQKSNINSLNKDKVSPLHLACQTGNTEIVGLLISKNGNIRAQDNNLFTPLHYAVQYGSSSIVELLISSKADIQSNQYTLSLPFSGKHKGCTALHIATHFGHIPIIELLISKNQDVNPKSKFGTTPLHIACALGNHTVANCLISKKANVNVQDEDLNTPLHKACSSFSQQTVELLISNSADKNSPNKNGQTPLQLLDPEDPIAKLLSK